MPSTGFFNFSALVNDASAGVQSWSSVANAQTSNDLRARNGGFAGQPANADSHYLKCTGLPAGSVPLGAKIDGVEVSVEWRGNFGAYSDPMREKTIRLVVDGVISGTNKSNSQLLANWPGEAVKTVGGVADTWGIANLIMNDLANFGVVYQVNIGTAPDSNTVVEVDHIQMRIQFTPAAGMFLVL